MAYRLSPDAVVDIKNIGEFGIEQFGYEQSKSYYFRLVKAFQFLSDFPFAARLRHEVRPPVRAYPIQAHVVVYEIDHANDILILRIHHAREDWLDL